MTPKAKKTSSKKAPAPAPKPVDLAKAKHPLTICIDIGGSGLKAMVLDAGGKPVSERQRIPTPKIPTPRAVLKGLDKLKKLSPPFDRVSVGFPGVIKPVSYTHLPIRADGKISASRSSPCSEPAPR